MNALVTALSSVCPRQAARRPARFGAVDGRPWLVWLEEKQAINRLVIETGGYYLWSGIFSRSRYELMETALDWAGWLLVGLAIPVTLGTFMKNRAVRKITDPKTFGKLLPGVKDKALSILEVPFELLDRAKSLKPEARTLDPIAKGLGFANGAALTATLNAHPKLAESIRNSKIAILAMDIGLMACKGQLYNWGSKWLTQKLSGKTGFSGEFAYTSEAFRKAKTEKFDKVKRNKLLFSFGLGFGGATLLPVLTMLALRSPNAVGKGFLGRFKSIIPAFNYVDAVYMSKWVILWHNIFNFSAPSILSARDGDELRERILKVSAFDMFYFFGDDLLNSGMARWLQSRPKNRALLKGVSLMSDKKNWIGIKPALRLSEVYQMVGHNASHPAYKLARKSFWFGFIGTTLGLGIATNLANNIFTRRKVTREQAQWNRQQQAVRLRQTMQPATPVSGI